MLRNTELLIGTNYWKNGMKNQEWKAMQKCTENTVHSG